MVFVRKSVWAAGGDFSDPLLLWYARGINILKQRPIADPTSWGFLAAIHGIDSELWKRYGYLTPSDQLPSLSIQNLYWNQCQHRTWYFLPWHRGYLLSLEVILRDAIVKAGGPADWALPYWNYSDQTNPNALQLPPAFSRLTLPDGSANPLFVKQRYGQSMPFPSLPLPARNVVLDRVLNLPTFTGQANGGSPGFGGVATGFSHNSGVSGRLESQPHNLLHSDIGGRNSEGSGLMSDPDVAALDPIFWLHHSNIDRLWEVWLRRNPQHQNPTEAAWLNGPVDRGFIVPLANGQGWQFAPKDVTQTTAPQLDYMYDDVKDPLSGVTRTAARLDRLGISPRSVSATGTLMESQSNNQSGNQPNHQPKTELIGANQNRVAVIGAMAATQVQLDNRMMGKVAQSFAPFTAGQSNTMARSDTTAQSRMGEPDRIFLNLENIRSGMDGALIDVYVNLPRDADPTKYPHLCVGAFALFGTRQASLPDQPHGGQGTTEVFDITDIVDELLLSGDLNITQLEVTLLPRSVLSEDYNITIDRVSLYRQGS